MGTLYTGRCAGASAETSRRRARRDAAPVSPLFFLLLEPRSPLRRAGYDELAQCPCGKLRHQQAAEKPSLECSFQESEVAMRGDIG